MEAPAQRHSATSLAAAKSIEPHQSRLHKLVLEKLAQSRFGETDESLMQLTGLPANTLRPRRRELQIKGKIKDSGQTRKTASGRQATVWVVA
jgi:hypothetical protein